MTLPLPPLSSPSHILGGGQLGPPKPPLGLRLGGVRWGAAPCAGSTVNTPPCGPGTGTTQWNASPERGWPPRAPFPWNPGCSRSGAAGELWKWPLGPCGWALASPSRVPNGLALFRNRCNGLQSTAQSPGDQPRTSSDGHQRLSTTASISLALLLPSLQAGALPTGRVSWNSS